MKLNLFPVAIVIIAGLSVALVKSCSDASSLQSDNDVLRSDNNLQGQVIATQAFNFSRFNQVAEETGRLNSLIDYHTDDNVIEYREILRREKTCDLPVPASVAAGLLEYTNRLRAGAVHADTGSPDESDTGTAAARKLTYCQAVLWINPLLAAIDKANNQLNGIRKIERERRNEG
ncbi:hypothetical protein [Enterobacter cloacae]|uniref:hypothetical protein n=1 Tax=Enterobacter cloacae TaxID=550 RepID=UPI002A49B281|nr:hypothetical protein [Enterobacter cloacae]